MNNFPPQPPKPPTKPSPPPTKPPKPSMKSLPKPRQNPKPPPNRPGCQAAVSTQSDGWKPGQKPEDELEQLEEDSPGNVYVEEKLWTSSSSSSYVDFVNRVEQLEGEEDSSGYVATSYVDSVNQVEQLEEDSAEQQVLAQDVEPENELHRSVDKPVCRPKACEQLEEDAVEPPPTPPRAEPTTPSSCEAEAGTSPSGVRRRRHRRVPRPPASRPSVGVCPEACASTGVRPCAPSTGVCPEGPCSARPSSKRPRLSASPPVPQSPSKRPRPVPPGPCAPRPEEDAASAQGAYARALSHGELSQGDGELSQGDGELRAAPVPRRYLLVESICRYHDDGEIGGQELTARRLALWQERRHI